ncbi:MAG: fluoride efflux transporter CrcB [Cytophagaceae bacterium]|jgi:CrcB protein|nr:fluoride efflux transporter CrcB [Cytophagaceae bacterium]
MGQQLFWIGVGGGLGSICRYLLHVLFVRLKWTGSLPWYTISANVIGCFLVGWLMGYFFKNQQLDSSLKFFLINGFCGGFTTFSAFSYESVSLYSQQSYTAYLNVIITFVFSIAATKMGWGIWE